MFDRKLAYTFIGIITITALAIGLTFLPESADLAEIHEAVSHLELREPNEQEDNTVEERQPAYLMREHEGYIAVYVIGEKDPFMVLDTRVKFLPDYDQTLLEKGIEIKDSQELGALIEDYIR